MIERRLKTVIVVYLLWNVAMDLALFVMAWVTPQLWFRVFHSTTANPLEIALLRRCGGQWLSFAIAQAITLLRWKEHPVWLAMTAGVRFTDIFTDVSYIAAIPTINPIAWVLLFPFFFVNIFIFVILLRGYRQAVGNLPAAI